ncbi:MAG: hypothetical protein HXY22_05135 [Alphaproteobacteria bacterium]|nr:hypothetical protein [Alphaproteobacteria bacterium]
MRLPTLLSCCAAIALALGAGAALAGPMTVVASDAPDLKPGDVIRDGESIKVPEGASVQLFTLTGREIVVKGPFVGFPGGEGSPPEENKLVLLASVIFGTAEMTVDYGMPQRNFRADPGASLDISSGGTWCIAKGQPVMLTRGLATQTQGGQLTALNEDRTVAIEWAEGARATPWPQQLPPEDGAVYQLRRPGAGPVTFTLRVTSETDNPAQQVAQMAVAGCRAQVEAALTTLRAPADFKPARPKFQ